MPFGQYICSDILSSIREKAAEDERKELKNRLDRFPEEPLPESAAQETPPEEAAHPETAEGVINIELGIGGLTGQIFFSQPTAHGLGPSDAFLLEDPSVFYAGKLRFKGVVFPQGKVNHIRPDK